MKPNFLILGVGKSGTTSLAHNLDRHPDVFISSPKEPWFFDGPQYDERSLDWYWNRYFSEWSGEKAVGEASSQNLFVPFVTERLHSDLPDARLIAILRHPVDRAFSHWWMNTSFGVEDLSFESAVEDNLHRLERGESFSGDEGRRRWYDYMQAYRNGELRYRCYVDMGYYAEQIERYLKYFPESAFQILLLSDLKQDFRGALEELSRFLAIDPGALASEPVRRSEAYGSRFMYRLVNTIARTGVQYLVPRPVRQRLGSLLRQFGSKPEMRPAVRERLLEHYEPRVRRLEALLERDLSDWRT